MSKTITLKPSTINIILTKLHQEVRTLKDVIQVDDQRWYWSEPWQTMEKAADEALKSGDFVEFDNVEDCLPIYTSRHDRPAPQDLRAPISKIAQIRSKES